MIRLRRIFFALVICVWIFSPACIQDREGEQGDIIRVALERDDSEILGIMRSFIDDEEQLAPYLEKYPVVLPEPLPDGVTMGMFPAGPIYGFYEKSEDGATVKLILDINTNFDLTDDVPIELASVEDLVDGPLIEIARSYEVPEAHTDWLPYRLAYREDIDREGQRYGYFSLAAHYTFIGDFELNGVPHEVRLYDGDARGRFEKEKAVNVTLRVGPTSDMGKPGAVPHHRPFELVPLADALYEVKDLAEDGSWIAFAPSGLEPTSLGKAAPDFEMTDTEGQTFRISDYLGKVVVLDFWYVWCKPCIAKFPAIKKMIEGYEDKPFAAIGVNIDDAARVEQAHNIIADHELTWRQVVEGKGEFIPVYQIYGRLPERAMSFPIYVAIDERGVTRYATNDFEKMGRFLEAHFNDPEGPDNTQFVSLSQKYGQEAKRKPVNAVDFTDPRVEKLISEGKLELPKDAPPEARIGLLSNGIPLIAYPGPEADTLSLVFDADLDFDFAGEKTHTVQVMGRDERDVPEDAKTLIEGFRLPYANGAIGFLRWPFYARAPALGTDGPEVYYEGEISYFAGSFFVGDAEYSLEIADMNGDRLFTERDPSIPGFLTLKKKENGDWTTVHEGTDRIPIGGNLYRLRYVSDDGYLVELEKE